MEPQAGLKRQVLILQHTPAIVPLKPSSSTQSVRQAWREDDPFHGEGQGRENTQTCMVHIRRIPSIPHSDRRGWGGSGVGTPGPNLVCDQLPL